MSEQLRNILFDFFGTLVEYSPSRTEQGYDRSHRLVSSFGSRLDYDAFLSLWSAVSEELDQMANHDLSEFSMHDAAAQFLRRAIDRRPTERMIDAFVKTYIREWNAGVRYLDGLTQFLGRLKPRFRLGIVTNTHLAALVEDHLVRMDAPSHFDVVVTSIAEGRRKPHPQIFLRALELLGAGSAETLFVGDSYEADYLGARRVGMNCFLIDPSQNARVPPEHRISDLFELERRLPIELTR